MSVHLPQPELELLAVLARMHHRGMAMDEAGITRLVEIKIPDLIGHWPAVMPGLIESGLIHAGAGSDTGYAFSQAGLPLAAEVEAESILDLFFYEAFYERAETSAAHGRFCELVYGRNLCQHGMADLDQLDLLAEVLRRKGCRRGLELGCGNGMATAYLAEAAGIELIGVDFARRAIERANKRTEQDPRLQFKAMDLNKLDLPAACFDAIVAVDSLSFARDLRRTIEAACRLLSVHGIMALFYNPHETKPSAETELGKVLTALGGAHEAVDLTAENIRHWRRKEEVLPTLAGDFAVEDNMFLYVNRRAENEGMWMKTSRYLFIFSPPPTLRQESAGGGGILSGKTGGSSDTEDCPCASNRP